MPKDDPLEPSRPGYRTAHATLWLDREGMLEARENYWRAYHASIANEDYEPGVVEYRTWNIAWAAAVAAFSFIMEGRIAPK